MGFVSNEHGLFFGVAGFFHCRWPQGSGGDLGGGEASSSLVGGWRGWGCLPDVEAAPIYEGFRSPSDEQRL